MLRVKYAVVVFALALSVSAQSQFFHLSTNATNCKFEIPTTDPTALSCDNDLDRGVASICTVKFINNGTDACTGHFTGFLGPATQGSVDQASTTVIPTTCRTVGLTKLPTPLSGVTALDTAARCEGDGTVQPGQQMTMTARITPSQTFAAGRFPIGVTDSFAGATNAAVAEFDLSNCNLTLSGPSVSQSGVPYALSWSTAFNPTTYEIQESASPDFSNATTTTASGVTQQFTHTATGSPATFYYRVRATTCRGSLGPYSQTATVTITPAADPTSRTFDMVVPQGSTTVITQLVHFDGLVPSVAFTATVDQPFLTVTPATGTTSNTGSVDLTVRANPTSLGIGANTGTVTVTTARSKSGRLVSLADNTKSVPVSVSVASPVTSNPKTPPPSATWVIPAVAHATGIGAQFVSDVRLANVNATTTSSYQLTFTATNSDGTKSGKQTKIDLAPGQTAALNDVLHDYFGLGTTSATNASGVLEIRALGTNPAPGTVASSRTYSVATAGTFGQNVPAVPIDRVATSDQRLILAHTGQTVTQRLNIGVAESLGFPSSGHIRAFDIGGSQLADMAFTLQPFEHQQINSFLARNGITASAARIDVIMDAAVAGRTAGGVTAYAAMLDNTTHDASVVAGIKTAAITANRFILPGIAEGTAVGEHSEVRVLNAGATTADTTFTIYPRSGNAIVKSVSIGSGELKTFNNIVASLFGLSATDGSLVVTTTSNSQLLVSGRTFSTAATGGTFGQLQTALLSTDGLGSSDSDAQILQLEESDRFRSDLGLVELTGAGAQVHVTFYPADQKVSVSTDISLNANEFRNEQSIISRITGTTASTYNGRISVKVTGGTGRIAAYGTLVDKATGDPTLLPAQK